MNKSQQACMADQRMSKSTLLAMLVSHLDYDQAIELETGKIIAETVYYKKNIIKILITDYKIYSYHSSYILKPAVLTVKG